VDTPCAAAARVLTPRSWLPTPRTATVMPAKFEGMGPNDRIHDRRLDQRHHRHHRPRLLICPIGWGISRLPVDRRTGHIDGLGCARRSAVLRYLAGREEHARRHCAPGRVPRKALFRPLHGACPHDIDRNPCRARRLPTWAQNLSEYKRDVGTPPPRPALTRGTRTTVGRCWARSNKSSSPLLMATGPSAVILVA
jgi:hypothetical protein